MNFPIEISEMTEKQANKNCHLVLSELSGFIERNPQAAQDLLAAIVEPIESLEQEDFFGTEGLIRE